MNAHGWDEAISKPVPEGRRKQTLAQVAGLLFRRLPSRAAAELAYCWAQSKLQPALPEAEVRRTIESIADRSEPPNFIIEAELALGLEQLLELARHVGALDEVAANADEAGAAQLEDSDPVQQFLDLLGAAIVAGNAHIADGYGRCPVDTDLWGWLPKDRTPVGPRVGWIEGDDLFLLPAAAYRSAKSMAAIDELRVTPTILFQSMRDRGLLVSSDPGRNTVTRRLQWCSRTVVHLKAEALFPQDPDRGEAEPDDRDPERE